MFYKVVKTIVKLGLSIIFRIEVEGIENIPNNRGCIICANHFNFLDPVLISVYLPRKINYMAKEELFSNKIFGNILKKLGVFPVKRGAADIGAIKASLRILKNGEVFGIFPEGTRSKSGEVLEAKPGLAMIAIKSQSVIIPVAIIGNYKPFSKMKIVVDKPINLENYYNDKLTSDEYQQLSQKVLDRIAYLRDIY